MINSVLNNTTQFTPISLKNMDGVKLMNRSDTKFTFSSQKLPILLEKLIPFYNVLEINGKRLHSYKSLYFDTDKRKFQFEVVTTDYYGRKSTGVYFLTSSSPNITGCDVNVGSNLGLNFQSTKTSGLKYVDIYASTTTGFQVIQESLLVSFEIR